MLTPENIKQWFKLQSNSEEGGFFAGVYTSAIRIPNTFLPGFLPPTGKHALCSAIYYFLESGTFSAMHKVTGNMIYHFYSGDPVQMLLLYPDGSPNKYEICTFSNDIAAGAYPMKVIPGGTWMGSRLTPGGTYSLMGVTMDPGFDPADYTIGRRQDLITKYPEVSDMITDFTRG
ncbi:cupin domain-containing protein [Chitinophaga sp. RAB17]|uniref:cupin domain-containing protein n=1 Tax=Chitinophaga sp. RAB17 TaxID=3233049 RepID=UPI003F8E0B37